MEDNVLEINKIICIVQIKKEIFLKFVLNHLIVKQITANLKMDNIHVNIVLQIVNVMVYFAMDKLKILEFVQMKHLQLEIFVQIIYNVLVIYVMINNVNIVIKQFNVIMICIVILKIILK
jgi:hypothetical protein